MINGRVMFVGDRVRDVRRRRKPPQHVERSDLACRDSQGLLARLAKRRLATLGVTEVWGGAWCTYADASRFFSFRRDGRCGRMAALIWLE